ncbi:filamentous hemagglutinin N-terminal domain-containing protein [bacterium]|nr:filamentous hemagglutinin N-terminal domain-containing protein [bacterium]
MSLRHHVSTAALLLALIPDAVLANPMGGQVVAGQAGISARPGFLQINQSSNRAVIDWRSFDLAPGDITRFNQPNAGAWTLNRVNAADPSRIFGTIQANGRIAIINPNGVVFGPGSHVDAAGIVASTADTTNARFMAGGKVVFDRPGDPHASIVNEGTITARDAGLVGLVAPNVENSGVITARLGKVQLAAGETFTLDMAGDRLLEVAISDGVAARLKNSGTIRADGGDIVLTAAAGRHVVDALIEQSGVISANRVGLKGGHITLYAAGSNAVSGNRSGDKGVKTGSSRVNVSGVIQASDSANLNSQGGSIDIWGDYVHVAHARLDASGNAGGGVIRIGGDYHGEGLTPTALQTYVETDVGIYADAFVSGHGGNVTLWADGQTDFYGNISTRGGERGGDGGFVEVSGHDLLNFSGTVDTLAPRGNTGILLLDPNDINITAADSNINCTAGTCSAAGAGASTLNVATLVAALGASNVIVTTAPGTGGSGDITVTSAINWNTGFNLTLNASRNITINNTITGTGAGALTLTAGGAGNIDINNNISVGGLLTTNAGTGNTLLSANMTSYGMTLNAPVVMDGALGTRILNAKTGVLTINGAVSDSNGNNNLSLLTDNDIALNANLGGTTSRSLFIASDTAGHTIGLAGQAGVVNLTTAELNRIQSNWGAIVFGSTGANSSAINAGAYAWQSALTFNSNADSITIAGNTSTSGAGHSLSIISNADPIINANLSTSGNNSALFLSTASAGTTLGIAGGAGTFNISAAELAMILPSNFIYVQIGNSSAMTNAIELNGYTAWNLPFRLQAPNGININGAQTSTSTMSFSTGVDINFNQLITATQISVNGIGNTSIGIAGQAGAITIDNTELSNLSASSYTFTNGNTATNAAIDLGAHSWGSASLTIDSGNATNAGNLIVSGAQSFTTGNFTLATGTGDIVFNDNVAGGATDTLTVSSRAAAGGSIVWNGTGGTTNLDSTDLSHISGFQLVQFGQNVGGIFSTPITVNAYTWSRRATFISTATITVDGAQEFGNNSVQFQIGSTPVFNADINGTSALSFLCNIGMCSGKSMGIAGGAGTIQLDDPLLDHITSNWSTLNIGGPSSNGNTGYHPTTIDVGAYTWRWNTQFNSGYTTPITFSGAADFSNKNITINAGNDVIIGANLSGTGALTIRAFDNTVAGIGLAGGTGIVNISAAELDFLQNGFSSIKFGLSSQAQAIDLGAYSNWKDPLEFYTTSLGTITVSGAQATSVGNNASFSFQGPTTFNAGVSTNNSTSGTGTITLGNFSHVLKANLLTNNSNITINGATTLSGAALKSISAGSGTITTTAAINSAASSLSLTANTLTLGANITGASTRALLITAGSAGRAVYIGGGSGGLDLDDTTLSRLDTGWAQINIYNLGASGAGGIYVDSTTLHSNLRLQGLADGITITGPLDVQGHDLFLYANGGDIAINGAVTSAGGHLTIGTMESATGNEFVSLGGGGVYNRTSVGTTTIGVGGAAGTITLSDAELDNITDGWSSIEIGDVDDIGGTPFTIAINVDAYSNWKDPITFNAASTGAITVSGAQTTLAASNGGFTFNGPTTFNASINTSNSSAATGTITLNNFLHVLGADLITDDSNITIHGQVDASADFTINAGTGNLTLGATSSITSLGHGVTLTADNMDIQGDLTGNATAQLNIGPSTITRNMQLATGSGTELYLTAAELDHIQDGWGTVYFGGNTISGLNANAAIGNYAWGDYGVVFNFRPTRLISIAGGTFQNDVQFVGNMDISGSLNGSGSLLFNNYSGAAIGLAGAAGTVQLSVAELDFIADGWGSIQFGDNLVPFSTSNIVVNGYSNWKDDVIFAARTGHTITISGNQSTAVGTDGNFTFDGPTTFNANVDTSNSTAGTGTITLGNFSHALNGDLTTNNSDITINGATTLSGATRSINAGTGAFNTTATISSTASNLILTADSMSIGADITGAAARYLSVRTGTAGRAINLGGGVGGLDLDDTELDHLDNGWTGAGSVRIGDYLSGTITLDGFSFHSNMNVLRNANGVVVDNALDFNGNDLSFWGDTGEITLNGTLASAGGDLHVGLAGNGLSIGLGGAVGTGTSLSDAELDNILDGWNSIQFGNFDGTKNILINIDGYNNWRDPISFGTSSLGLITVSGVQATAAGSNGSFTFSGPTQFDANVDTTNSSAGAGTITLSNYTHALNANLITDDSDITINGSVTTGGAGNRLITAGTGTIITGAGGTISSPGNDLVMTADNMTIGAAMSGGWLYLRASTAGRAVNVGGPTGGLDLSDAELGFIDGGWTRVTIGNYQAGVVTLDAFTFNDALAVRGGSGGVVVSGPVNLSGNSLYFDMQGGDLQLNSTIASNGANLSITNTNNATTIGLGGAAGVVALSDAELDNISDGWSSINIGSGSLNTVINMGAYNNWKDRVILQAAAGGGITVSGAQTTAAGTNGRFTFDGPTTFNANVDTSNSSATNGAIVLNNHAYTLGADLITDDSLININGTVALSGGAGVTRLINAGTATVSTSVTGIINAGVQNLLLRGGDLAIGANISGTGALILRGAGAIMNIATGAGGWNLDAAEIGRLQNGFSSILIDSNSNAAMNIGASTWNDAVTFKTGTGDITLSGTLTSVGTAGNSLVLATQGNFVNMAGAGALAPGAGRYLVYSTSPSLNAMGGIGGYSKQYGKNYASNLPATIPAGSNYFLYSIAPTVTLTAHDVTRYDNEPNPAFSYQVSGLIDGDMFAQAFTGTPVINTTLGSSSPAGVYLNGLVISAGAMVPTALGYLVQFVHGTMTILASDPAPPVAPPPQQYTLPPSVTSGLTTGMDYLERPAPLLVRVTEPSQEGNTTEESAIMVSYGYGDIKTEYQSDFDLIVHEAKPMPQIVEARGTNTSKVFIICNASSNRKSKDCVGASR